LLIQSFYDSTFEHFIAVSMSFLIMSLYVSPFLR
jgi:hypothetical protein